MVPRDESHSPTSPENPACSEVPKAVTEFSLWPLGLSKRPVFGFAVVAGKHVTKAVTYHAQ